jgi:DNA-directed RNA polymerase, beta'' subunit/160 kD subunit
MERRYVTTPTIYDGITTNIKQESFGLWRFHPEGLFSAVIFGPLFDYTCDCGKKQPRNYTCPVCGVTSESSLIRNANIAYIKLNEPIIHPLVNYVLYHTGFVLHPNNILYYDEDKKSLIVQKQVIPHKHALHPTLLFIHLYSIATNKSVDEYTKQFEIYYTLFSKEIYETIAEDIYKTMQKKILFQKLMQKPLNDLLMYEVKVLPAGLREIFVKQYNTQKSLNTNIANLYLYKILKAIKSQQELPKILPAYVERHYTIAKLVQQYFETLIVQMTKKKGIIRRYKLGRRIMFSHRAVLVGNPALKYNEITISYYGGLQVLYLPLIRYLLETTNKVLHEIQSDINKALQTYIVPEYLKAALEEVIKQETQYVLLMRQPVLHLPSTQRFKIVGFHDDLVIAMNQLMFEGYNADVDGDTVVIFWLDNLVNSDNFDPQEHIYTPRGTLNIPILYDSLLGLLSLQS